MNLGTGQGYSVLKMVKAFEKASGHDVLTIIVDPRRTGPALGRIQRLRST